MESTQKENLSYQDVLDKDFAPWKMEGGHELNSFHLWSLMDLLRIYAEHYIGIGENLAYVSVLFKAAEDAGKDYGGHPLSEKQQEDLKQFLLLLKVACDQLNLRVSSDLLADAARDLPQGYREMWVLSNAIKKEIKSKMFLFIPSQRAKYYEWQLPTEMQPRFPNCSYEMIRAGKCYAKGEFTACVFHSMRAAELGLRALAKHLNVTFPFPIDLADWQNLITNIESVIKKAEQQPKSETKDRELKFCSAAASQFRYFKEAYRKHVNHAREPYDEEQALSIMERTGEFLNGLSKKIGEPEN